MNMALIRKELREAMWKLVLGLLILLATAVSLPFTYGMITDILSGLRGSEMDFLLSLVPMELLENYSAYIWSQWNGKNLLNIGTLMAVLLGMGMVAGEVSNQTIGFLLSRPVSRRAVISGKIVSGALILGIMIGVSTVFLLLLASVYSPEPLAAGRLALATLITYLGLLVVFTLTVLFSSLMDDPVKAAGVTILVLLGVYLVGWFPVARTMAFFRYISAADYFLAGGSPLWPVVTMLAAAAVLAAASVRIVERKEF